MNEAKQKAIQESYGEYWDKVKDFVGDSGWCYTRKRIGFTDLASNIELESDKQTPYHFRPKSLQNIEDNNGWIKIESEEDLPKESINCHFMTDLFGLFYGDFQRTNKTFYFIDTKYTNVTHYQPIVKPKPPIY